MEADSHCVFPESNDDSIEDVLEPHCKKTKKRNSVDIGVDSSKSKVWEHFIKDLEKGNCKCRYCAKEYKCDSRRNGTSNLWNHLRTQCRKYWATLDDEKQATIANFCASKKISSGASVSGVGSSLGLVGNFNQETCRKAVAIYVIINEIPFREVESYGFQLFCDRLCPKFSPPSRRTLVRDIYQLYLDEKKSLKKLFTLNKYRVAITTDTWTSVQNFCYMVLTAHWVDNDWKLQKRILNFYQITSHKGESIGKFIENSLLEWGIDRVMTVTVDNASANDVAVNYLKKKLRNWKGNTLFLNGDYLHMWCCAHIVNLIVNEGLKDLHDSIASIRNAIMYVRSSGLRMHTFKSYVERDKLKPLGC